MFIEKFGCSNFKPYKNSIELNLVPLTLIYGPNSSGKSSLFQSLLLLAQSHLLRNSSQNPLPELLIDSENGFVDMGTWTSLVNAHQGDKTIEYMLETHDPAGNRIHSSLQFRGYPHQHPETGLTVYQVLLDEISLSITPPNTHLSQPIRLKRENRDGQNESAIFRFADKDSIQALLSIISNSENLDLLTDSIFSDQNIYVEIEPGLFPGTIRNLEVPGHPYIDEMLIPFSQALGLCLENISYLGPIRQAPNRYTSKWKSNHRINSDGSDTAELLFENPESLERLNFWLHRLEIKYTAHISRMGKFRPEELDSLGIRYDQTLENNPVLYLEDENGNLTTPTDVGFGISQILPILARGLATKEKLICIEQPEIHLHPKLQAHLADFFLETSGIVPYKSGTNTDYKPCRWIIETHSETLMLRLQRRMRVPENNISPKNIAVIYVAPTSMNGTRLKPLRLDDQGEFIDEWPGGFFEEDFDEIFGGN